MRHCLGAVDSATLAMHCLVAWEKWVVELLSCIAAPAGGSEQCNSCQLLPHCVGPVGSGNPAMHCHTALGQGAVQLLQCIPSVHWGIGRCNSYNTLPNRLWAVGTTSSAKRCHTAWARWVVELVLHAGPQAGCTVRRPGGGRCHKEWNLCNAQSNCLWAVGSGNLVMHCHTALAQWAVEPVQLSAVLPGGNGQCTSCTARA